MAPRFYKLNQASSIPEFAGIEEKGLPTNWVKMESIILSGGLLHIVDISSMGSEGEGLLLSLAPGSYLIKLKLLCFAYDFRVAGVRIFKATDNKVTKGRTLGEVSTDTAEVAIYEFQKNLKPLNKYGEKNRNGRLEFRSRFGVGFLSHSRKFITVHSGFGDGRYFVNSLLCGSQTVGAEITFLKSQTKYPIQLRTPIIQ